MYHIYTGSGVFDRHWKNITHYRGFVTFFTSTKTAVNVALFLSKDFLSINIKIKFKNWKKSRWRFRGYTFQKFLNLPLVWCYWMHKLKLKTYVKALFHFTMISLNLSSFCGGMRKSLLLTGLCDNPVKSDNPGFVVSNLLSNVKDSFFFC